MSILNNSLLLGADAGAAGYQISRSLRFNSSDSAYCLRTPSSNGTSYTTWTWSMWVKRSLASTGQVLFSAGVNTQDYLIVNFEPGDTLRFLTGENGSTNQNFATTVAVFRDYSAWYHLVIQADFTNATQADRVKIYANGVRQALSGTIAAQNYSGTTFNRTGIAHNIGRQGNGVSYFSGYLADIHFIDGQALDPSSFTEVSATTGQLIPKAYTGSYGTNGFRLDFSDNSAATATTLGKDRAGSNNWTPNNLSVTAGAGNDSLVDTPTSYGTDTGAGGEVRGNYCTLNPLDIDPANGYALSNGNLEATLANAHARGTVGIPSSGKWYFEVTASRLHNGQYCGLHGITKIGTNSRTGILLGTNSDAGVYKNGVQVQAVAGLALNDVLGIALNMDSLTLQAYKNGSAWGSALSIDSASYVPHVGGNGNNLGDGSQCTANFGQRPFAYTAPSGFKALCDTNLPAPTIAKPSTVMDVKLYTGNGSTQTISGLGFSPDLVWIKERNAAADHALYDIVRGTQNRLESNTTDAEATSDNGLTAFNSDGFALGSLAQVNTNADTYVAWTWDAGSSTVTNTQGSITSQVRANASAGFSVCTFTTQSSSTGTFGHGLNVAPSLVITKARAVANNWITYHASVGNTGALLLNSTAATDTQSFYWNNTTPTSTVVTLGSGFAGSNSLVAYCFAPVAGYSSFGSYTGNGSTDGPFVFTGFRPRWVMVKRSDSAESWIIIDAARDTYNLSVNNLFPNQSLAEQASASLDILSNGFKLRSTTSGGNTSGGTYVYAAFAESPFAHSRAR